MSFVVLTRGIDLSVGSIVAFSGVLGATLMEGLSQFRKGLEVVGTMEVEIRSAMITWACSTTLLQGLRQHSRVRVKAMRSIPPPGGRGRGFSVEQQRAGVDDGRFGVATMRHPSAAAAASSTTLNRAKTPRDWVQQLFEPVIEDALLGDTFFNMQPERRARKRPSTAHGRGSNRLKGASPFASSPSISACGVPELSLRPWAPGALPS